VVGVWNRGEERRNRARELVDAPILGGRLADAAAELSRASLILICVSDDAVSAISEELSQCTAPKAGTIIAHTSGCLDTNALTIPPDCFGAGIHPLVACPNPQQARDLLRSATYALEGPPPAVNVLEKLVRHLGGSPMKLTPGSKASYHASAVMASNLVVSLLAEACAVARDAGIDQPEKPLVKLALGALEQVANLGALDALTGPVVRGDTATIAKHLQALPATAAPVYRSLSIRALAIARERNVDRQAAEEIERLLKAHEVPAP
jgi:predicted short-subunit dehydrogenase-like oxidoreductase (DUF2520 family)